MTKLYVSEYSGYPVQGGDITSPIQELSTDQVVDYTAGEAKSTAFKANTNVVRIAPDSICSISFGTNPTSTTSNKRMAAGTVEYFGVQPGWKVSAITNT